MKMDTDSGQDEDGKDENPGSHLSFFELKKKILI